MSARLHEQVAMVADVYEVEAINADVAVKILREVTGKSPMRCARKLAAEMRRREDDAKRRERETAVQYEDRDDDGSWTT